MYVYTPIYKGQFISPSGISDLCGTVAGMVTPKASMPTERERLQVSVLPYRCSICPPLVTLQMSILQNSKTHNSFVFPAHAMFRHDCHLAVKPASMPRRLVRKKTTTWRDSLPIDMLLSAVSVLVAAQPSSEVPEGLMNYPVYVAQTEYSIYYPGWARCNHWTRLRRFAFTMMLPASQLETPICTRIQIQFNPMHVLT